MAKTPPSSGFDAVLEEHHALHATVVQLRRFLRDGAPPPRAPGASAWAGELGDRLVEFRDRTLRHFQTEERTDFLGELARSSPSATRASERLRCEHDRILQDLRNALDATTAFARGQAPARDLREQVLAILDTFEQHETTENELIQSIVCDDVGAGD